MSGTVLATPVHAHAAGAEKRAPQPLGETSADQLAARLAWALVAVGILLRTVRFVLCYPLFPDEAFQASNLLDRDYLGLLRPLNYAQVCPVLALWAQHTLVSLLGWSEYSLRLFWFGCGIGALLLMRHVAGRLLRGTALLVAVGLFAVSYPLVRHSTEAKPYAGDLLASLVLLALTIEWLRCRTPHAPREDLHDGRRSRWLWALAIATPLALGISNSMVFVAGAIGLVIACRLICRSREHGWTNRIAFVAFAVSLAGSVAAVAWLKGQADLATTRTVLREMWPHAVPPDGPFWHVPVWLLKATAGPVTDYPLSGMAVPTFLCAAVGAGVWLRRGQGALLALLGVPLVLSAVAAALSLYPYGGHVRFMLYAAPMVCLASGVGLAWLIEAGHMAASKVLARRGPAPPHPQPLSHVGERGEILALPAPLSPAGAREEVSTHTWLVAAACALIAAGILIHSIVKPYRAASYLAVRDFTRWLSSEQAHGDKIVDLWADGGITFSSRPYLNDLSALYYCNWRIYAHGSRAVAGEPTHIAILRPTSLGDFDEQRFNAWLVEQQKKHPLVRRDRYPLAFEDPGSGRSYVDHVEVLEFKE